MKSLICVLIVMIVFIAKSFSQFEWKNTGGPFGSSSSLLFSNETYAFIPENDFLFRSVDGIHWENIEHGVSEFMYAYHDTLINIVKEETSGLFRFQISFDNGDNWIVKNLPDEINTYGDLIMCTHGIYLAQGLKQKIYRSTDLGDTWGSLSSPAVFMEMKTFDNKIYISADSLLERTDQTGSNWVDITPSIPRFRYVDDITAIDSNIMVTAGEYLFISTNNGQSWNSQYAYSNNSSDRMTQVGQYIYLNIAGALIRTYDFGIHWDTLITHFYPRAISFTGLGDILLASTIDRGILRLNDAGEMVESNEGLTKAVIYDLDDGADKIWAACGNGVFAYDISKAKWSARMNLPLTKFEHSFISSNNQGWVVTGENNTDQFYFSENQGQSWDTIKTGFNINDIQLLDEYIFVFGSKLIRSIDKGQSWDTLSFGVQSHQIIPFQGKNYIAGAGFLHFTSDNGLTWDSIKCPFKIFKLYSSCDRMYGIKSDYISKTDLYVSEDAIHWKHADTGFPDIDIITLWYHYHPLFFRDGDFQYAFLDSLGHYISSDKGLSWSSIETSQIGSDYLIHDQTIYLGGEGMYSAHLENP